MFRRVNKGLTIIEVLIVLAISAGLAVISIGAFSSRGRTQSDEAARLVMADIAKVRNDAVQGLGPTTVQGKNLVDGKELFGQAIEFRTNDSTFLGDTMRVYKLMIDSSNYISAYETYDIPITGGLKLYVPQTVNPVSAPPCNAFRSCYYNYQLGVANYETLLQAQSANRIIIFRNRTGQTYTSTRSRTACGLCIENEAGVVRSGLSGLDGYSESSQYPAGSGKFYSSNQGRLRISYGTPGSGATSDAQMQNARFKYYAIFDMQIPNNQEFQVVK